MRGYRQLKLILPAELVEPVSLQLEAMGAFAISLEGLEEEIFEPPPGETPLWQKVQLVALFGEEHDLQEVRKRLELSDRIETFEETFLPEKRWETLWQEHFKPLRFGRLYVALPSQPPQEAELIHLRLEPGLAFGTGTHPTTALCLEALAEMDLGGQRVIDYGCGSGILAIAALLLGACEAHAVDVDRQALEATEENARRNRVEVHLYHALHEVPAPRADLLVANILADPLIELAPKLAELVKLKGTILLSGILTEQATAVEEAYAPWFEFESPHFREGWVLLKGERR